MENETFTMEMMEPATNPNYTYCSPGYTTFFLNFPPGDYIILINFIIGCLGFFVNILCLLVFSQKTMRNPTNFILAMIALADLFVMFTFISKGVRQIGFIQENLVYFSNVMEIVGRVFFQVFHCVSVWITMTLAIWRYVAIVHPLQSRSFCTMSRARWTILSIFLIIIALNFHEYCQIKIVAADPTKGPAEGGCGSPYCFDYTDFTRANAQLIVTYTQWYQALIGGQIIPCIILTVVSIRLVIALIQAQHNRNRMTSSKEGRDKTSSSAAIGRAQAAKDKGQGQSGRVKSNTGEFDKTAKMLLVVLIVFVLTEGPVGALNICSLVLKTPFYKECYLPMTEHVVTLNILSGVLNFLIYVVMSVNFRKTLFRLVLRCRCCCREEDEGRMSGRNTQVSSVMSQSSSVMSRSEEKTGNTFV